MSLISVMAGLMSLSTELRQLIFGYCNLLVNGEIVPYPSSQDVCVQTGLLGGTRASQKLDVALLAVSRQIRREAAEILYGRNIWRLTVQPLVGIGQHVFRAQPLMFRHVVVAFDMSPITPEFLQQIIASARCRTANEKDIEHRRWLISIQVHDACNTRWRVLWQNQFLLTLSAMDLQTLECDIKSCYCVSGCCRLIGSRISWHNLTAQGHNTSINVIIKGAERPEEEKAIRDAIARNRLER